MNLINLLPQKDKELMEEYIYLYGTKNFIGLDEYLKHWEKSKKKLYRLLGGKFQLEIPYSCSVTEEEMRSYIMASMARHKVPKYISFVDHFPMNAAGKILKYKMREDAANRLGLTGDGADTAQNTMTK